MFTAESYWSTSLVRVELPARTLLMCEGADTRWGADSYVVSDPEFGSLYGGEIGAEGEGDFAPGGAITFAPPSATAANVLSSPAYQGSAIKIWLAEVSNTTGLVVGTPELLFSGFVDVPRLRQLERKRLLELGFVSGGERLFLRNRGNTLSTRHHQTVRPGELGFDNATGVQVAVAWGIEAPPRGVSSGAFRGGGGSILNGAFGLRLN